MIEDPIAELTRQLEEARREAAYYQRLSKECGDRRVRETEESSGLIAQLRRVENELEKARDEMEHRVQVRTAKLKKINERFVREMDERRKIEQELRKTNELLGISEERYRLLIETSESPVLVTALTDSRVLFINERAAHFFGVPAKEAVGEYAPDYWVYPETRKRFIADLVQHGRVSGFVALLQTRTGDQRWVLLSANLINYIDKRASFIVFSDITERKRVEEELLESEALQRTLLDSLAAGVVIVDAETHVIERINPTAAALFGAPVDQIQGRKCHRFLCPAQEGNCPITDQNQEVDNSDREILRADGTQIPILKSVKRIRIGGREKLLESFLDISQRKRAEEALRESKERFRSLVETISDWVWETDAQGVYTYASPKVKDLLGYEPSEVIGKTPFDLMPPEEAARLAPAIHGYFEKAEPFSGIQNLNLHKSGREIILETSGVPVLDDCGVLAGYRGIDRDITDRKRAEDRLNRINATLLNLGYDFDENLHALTALCGELLEADCALYSRLDGGFLCVKGQWHAPPDVKTEDRPEGHLCYDVIHGPGDGVLTVRHLQESEYAKTDPNVAAYGLQTYVGHPVHFGGVKRGSLCAVYTGDYEPSETDLRVLGIIASALGQEEEREHAEEERLQLERRLLDAQKLESLGIMAGGIAHDFNNLLSAILGNLELALLRLPQVSPVRVRLEQAMEATHRAVDLTGQMLAYSGRGRFVVTGVDLSQLVREKADLFRAVVARRNTLNLHLAAQPSIIEADSGQVQQVVMNLITNASEAMEGKPGTISLTTGVQECDEAYLSRSRSEEKPPAGRFAYVEVADTGCGMDEQTQQRLFDPFFTTKFVGRGLGMSAVLGIVRGHKGAIMVESASGLGTSIRVLFPVCLEESGTALEVPGELPPPSGTTAPSRTVLVVDDEESVREVGSAFLESLGFEAITAADGEEALLLFKQHADELACVLLDLTMPRMDGVSTFREMRRLRTDVPVILSSGFSKEEVTQRFTSQGLAGFIQKPYGLQTLKVELERVLRSFGKTARKENGED